MPSIFAKYGPDADLFPTNVADGVLKRNAANNGWEQVATGSIAPANIATAAATGTAATFARADHAHDLTEAVLRAVINEMLASPNFNAQVLQNLGAPSAATDAATKGYVDAAVAGARDVKDSCRLATAAAPAAYTRTANVITFSAVGSQSVDGSATVLNDRILLKNGAAGADNGIYTVTTKGDGVTAEVWTRATDADTSAEVTAGMFTWVTEGATNADSGWLLTTDDPITLNTTALTFTQVSGLGQVTAGAGLTKTGNTIDFVGSGADSGLVIAADAVGVSWGLVGSLSTVNAGDAAIAGTSGTAARADHQHAVATAAPVQQTVAAALAEGVAVNLARSDHAHTFATAVPATIGTANSEGVSTSFVRADHVHAHGAQTDGTLHAGATEAVAGFLSAADKTKLNDIGSGGATTDGTVQTTDATLTTLLTLATANNTVVQVRAWVTGKRSTNAQGAGYELVGTFLNNAGVLSQLGSTSVVAQHESDAAWDAQLNASGTNILAQVQGVAATTVDWRGEAITQVRA